MSDLKDNAEPVKKTKRKANKIVYFLRTIVFVTMILSIVFGVLNFGGPDENASQYFMSAFTCFVLMIVTFVPYYVNDREIILLPTAIETAFVIFTFLAMYLGEVFRFYDVFWWWDILLHSMSATLLGFIGFLLFYTLNRNRHVMFRLNHIAIALFSFCFAVSCGAMWEIFEFSGDMLLGMNMQKSSYIKEVTPEYHWNAEYVTREEYLANNTGYSGRINDPGLMDTMEDLIVDTIGSLFAVVSGYLFLKFRSRNTNTDSTLREISEDISLSG